LTLEAGQTFTGSSTVGTNTGQIAFTQTGTVFFNSATPAALTEVEIVKDVLGSSQTFSTPFGNVTFQTLSITSVTPNTSFQLTTSDLPPGVSIPPNFTLPQTVTGTLIDVEATVDTSSFGTQSVDVTGAIIGTDGPLVLVGDVEIHVFGTSVPAGAAVLSLGSQATGSGLSEVFTPVFTPAACFTTGTRIQTPEGEVAVEALREGQHVTTPSGGCTPVVWLGSRVVHPHPQNLWPVRIAAGAFGQAQPRRDLVLSPDHAVFVDGVLIPAQYLVNGSTIARQPAATVTYWHVELPAHGVLLAEGLPCESYLDTGNRSAFAESATAAAIVAGI
jgi:hypothetical protein